MFLALATLSVSRLWYEDTRNDSPGFIYDPYFDHRRIRTRNSWRPFNYRPTIGPVRSTGCFGPFETRNSWVSIRPHVPRPRPTYEPVTPIGCFGPIRPHGRFPSRNSVWTDVIRPALVQAAVGVLSKSAEDENSELHKYLKDIVVKSATNSAEEENFNWVDFRDKYLIPELKDQVVKIFSAEEEANWWVPIRKILIDVVKQRYLPKGNWDIGVPRPRPL